MFAILRIIILFVVIVGGLGFIIYNIAKFYFALAPNSNRIKEEFARIKSILSESKGELVPFSEREFQLVSGQIKEVTESGYTLGTFSTIYSEPLIIYGYYNFIGNDRSVLVVKTSKHTFEFNYLDNQVDILSYGNKIAYIDNEGLHAYSNEVHYKFLDHLDTEYIHIHDQFDNPIGKVIQPTAAHGINSRAIELSNHDDNYDEELFIAAAIYLMLS